jgi:hypothetical protein
VTTVVLALAAAVAGTAPTAAQASVVTPGIGVVEPDGALFEPGVSYPRLPPLTAAVTGWTPRPEGGAWEVASDGMVFGRHAPNLGSLGGHHLSQPIVGIAATHTGGGYWLVASDGGIFTFGDARFYGSTGGVQLNQPIVGMAPALDGRGYWLVASDGGIFTFGDAHFSGSVAGRASAPVESIARSGLGYVTTLADGSVWQFGPGEHAAKVLQLPIPRTYVAAEAQSQRAQRAVAVALAQVGTPYRLGGAQPGGFDCSGLVQFAYAAAGVVLPRTAAEQLAASPHIPLTGAQPGDLLFFYPGIEHVGIYLGDGLMVDAPHVGAFVRVEVFSPWFGPVMGVARPSQQ